MNFIDLFQRQIDKFNTDKKCDFCWFFSAPLEESATNIQELREDSKCCVQVMYLQDKQAAFSVQTNYDQRSTLITDRFCTENFRLLFLIPDTLGKNNYNEIEGHPIEESRSAVLMRLKDCISCDFQIDFCELIGEQWQVIRWEGYQRINYQNNNYLGYEVSVTLRKRVH